MSKWKINRKNVYMEGLRMKTRQKRLIKVGKTDVRNALGFFWHDRHKIYVAATKADVDEWRERGCSEMDLHPMEKLEDAFRESTALKFISWCKAGCIVRQGAHQVTFDYNTHKVVLRMR